MENEELKDYSTEDTIVYPEAESEEDKIAELSGEVVELRDSLTAEKIKVALLIAGVTAEKLDEASAMVRGLYGSGKSIEDAVTEIIGAYPHLRAVKREIPQFAAASSGGNDGFSAIRRIFSGK